MCLCMYWILLCTVVVSMYVLDIIVNCCCVYVCIGHYCVLLMCLCMYWILLCTVVVSMYVLDIIVNC